MPGRTRVNPPAAVLAAPSLDFANLADQTERTRVRTGSTKYGGPKNPFIPLVQQSYAEDTEKKGSGWRANMVTGAQVRELVKCLREAAEWASDNEIGIRFKFRFRRDDGEMVEQGNLIDTKTKDGTIRPGVPEDERNVEVKFTGRTRRGSVKPEDEEDEEEDDDSGTGNGDEVDDDEDVNGE